MRGSGEQGPQERARFYKWAVQEVAVGDRLATTTYPPLADYDTLK